MRLKSAISALLAMGSLMLPTKTATAIEQAPPVSPAATSTNQFNWDLYSTVAKDEKGNLFYSPYSIESALAMTFSGAKNKTAAEMARVLHLDSKTYAAAPDSVHVAFGDLQKQINASSDLGDFRAFDLVVANAIWGQKGYQFNPAFTGILKDRYAAGLEQLDFKSGDASVEASRLTINRWVEKQTRDKIKNLLAKGAVDQTTRMVLTNAIYFKSKWDSTFEKSDTKDKPFSTDAKTKVDVPTMHQVTTASYAEDDAVQVLELPYKFHRLSMVLVLPKKIEGLAAVESSLNDKSIANWTGKLEACRVNIALPKFKFTTQLGLAKTLKKMGMVDAFGDKADFTGITTEEPLLISEVIHQAFVDVNEEGTEAAAATAVIMAAGSAMPREMKNVSFHADRPFLFIIRDNTTSTILFTGRVMNPKE